MSERMTITDPRPSASWSAAPPLPAVSNPFPSYNVARVDQYVASMSNGQSNTSNLYIASSPNNGRLVIINPGHQNTCDWTAFASGYRIQPVLQALLGAGYSVFAMNMPGCGSVSAHLVLFSSYGNTAMSYFLEPAVRAMNYWDGHTHGAIVVKWPPIIHARVTMGMIYGDATQPKLASREPCFLIHSLASLWNQNDRQKNRDTAAAKRCACDGVYIIVGPRCRDRGCWV